MSNEFVTYDPLSRYPKEDRARIRDFFLRGNAIAVAVEDHNIDLGVLSHRAGVSQDVINAVMRGHILDIDEAVIRAIEDAISDIVGGGV